MTADSKAYSPHFFHHDKILNKPTRALVSYASATMRFQHYIVEDSEVGPANDFPKYLILTSQGRIIGAKPSVSLEQAILRTIALCLEHSCGGFTIQIHRAEQRDNQEPC